MSPADLDIYQDLLMLPDNDLLDLVDGKTDTDEPRFIPLVARLRHWQVQDIKQ
jgi:succinate dehydrogenase flavin-adding protein (antitoxin of CptAB toxin-antitoxin module)